jgi:hypothetical protein
LAEHSQKALCRSRVAVRRCGDAIPSIAGDESMMASRRSALRRSSGRLLEEAPRLIHQVVKTLVAAVDELTGERHSVLDLLECEER